MFDEPTNSGQQRKSDATNEQMYFTTILQSRCITSPLTLATVLQIHTFDPRGHRQATNSTGEEIWRILSTLQDAL